MGKRVAELPAVKIEGLKKNSADQSTDTPTPGKTADFFSNMKFLNWKVPHWSFPNDLSGSFGGIFLILDHCAGAMERGSP